jgi:hypothetical protein
MATVEVVGPELRFGVADRVGGDARFVADVVAARPHQADARVGEVRHQRNVPAASQLGVVVQ